MENGEWKPTDKRFVAFFDIMGFKEMVARNTHEHIVEKLTILKKLNSMVDGMKAQPEFIDEFNRGKTRSVTFSDSIIIFSKQDGKDDAFKILMHSYWLLGAALQNGIPIKGAISHGEVTVDFKTSLFFGQPIIDAFLRFQ